MIKGQRKGESLRPRLLLLDRDIFFAIVDVAHAGCDKVMCRATVEALQAPHDAGVDQILPCFDDLEFFCFFEAFDQADRCESVHCAFSFAIDSHQYSDSKRKVKGRFLSPFLYFRITSS